MVSDTGRIRVCVVYSAVSRSVTEFELELPAGASVRDALNHVSVKAALPESDLAPGRVGVWGRKVEMEHLLNDGDRIEVYRPLLVDPKVARRERFASQGARATGLFAKKRAGAKAGY